MTFDDATVWVWSGWAQHPGDKEIPVTLSHRGDGLRRVYVRTYTVGRGKRQRTKYKLYNPVLRETTYPDVLEEFDFARIFGGFSA